MALFKRTIILLFLIPFICGETGCLKTLPNSGGNGNVLPLKLDENGNPIPSPTISIKLVLEDAGRNTFIGSPSNYRRAACVDYRKVLRATLDYQAIIDGDLKDTSARYWVLFYRANKTVHKAIRRVADKSGFDMVIRRNPENLSNSARTLTLECPEITGFVVATIIELQSSNGSGGGQSSSL